ncbi:hypothetical protein K435DRAFT_857384 [Dendrothele bispora CBS 962.96]|uniref:Uncharacterized protein n=1 Tax=Dendrothele bispora (strain CBS 962.96) TaxID=1314807 RepID=A0A4S8M7B9_DENBC|nr:hypothetical protein K435DRAFT_857384 [Dendrothele bispora CBS 962.96]
MSSRCTETTVELCTHCHHTLHFEPLPDRYLSTIESGLPKSQVQAEFSNFETELDLVTKELEHARTVVDALRRRWSALYTLIENNRTMMNNYTRLLPQELLAEIFRWVCADVSLPHPVDQRHPAFVLGDVCSRWRNITLSMPILWSRIELSIVEEKDLTWMRMESMERFARLFLVRSCQSPLDIVLEIPARKYLNFDFEENSIRMMNFVTLGRIIQLFYAQSCRWRTASLSAWKRFFQNGTLPWPEELPIIESLQLDCLFNEYYDIDGIFVTLKQVTAPRLKTLTLLGDWETGADGLNIPSLQTLVCAYDLPYELELLTSLPPSISVILRDFEDETDFSDPPLTSHCRSLTLEPIFNSRSHDALTTMFQSLSLPDVRELHMGRGRFRVIYDSYHRPLGDIANMIFPVSAFMGLLRKSSASMVTHFSMHHYTISADDLLRILSELPSLTCLSIDERPGSGGVTTAMSFYKYALSAVFFDGMCLTVGYGSSGAVLAPNLTEVSFTFRPRPCFPGEAILNMVESRWNPLGNYDSRGPLERVKLVTAKLKGFDEAGQEQIRRLRNEGLHFEVDVL